LGDRPLDLADGIAGHGVDARAVLEAAWDRSRSFASGEATIRSGRAADGADVDVSVGIPQDDAAPDAEAVEDRRPPSRTAIRLAGASTTIGRSVVTVTG
jgi:hypothetical protein